MGLMGSSGNMAEINKIKEQLTEIINNGVGGSTVYLNAKTYGIIGDNNSHPISSSELNVLFAKYPTIPKKMKIIYRFCEAKKYPQLILPFHTVDGRVLVKSDFKLCFDNLYDNFYPGTSEGFTSDGTDRGVVFDETLTGVAGSEYTIDTTNVNYTVLNIVNNSANNRQHGFVVVEGDLFAVGDEKDYVGLQMGLLGSVANNWADNSIRVGVEIPYGNYLINKPLMYCPITSCPGEMTTLNIKGTGLHNIMIRPTNRNEGILVMGGGVNIDGVNIWAKQDVANMTPDCEAGLDLQLVMNSSISNMDIINCKKGLKLIFETIFNYYKNITSHNCTIGLYANRFICQSTFEGLSCNTNYEDGMVFKADGGWYCYNNTFIQGSCHFNGGIQPGSGDPRAYYTKVLTFPTSGMTLEYCRNFEFVNMYYEGNGTAVTDAIVNSNDPPAQIRLIDRVENGITYYNRDISFKQTNFSKCVNFVVFNSSVNVTFENSYIESRLDYYDNKYINPTTMVGDKKLLNFNQNLIFKGTTFGYFPSIFVSGFQGVKVYDTYPFEKGYLGMTYDSSTGEYTIPTSSQLSFATLDYILKTLNDDGKTYILRFDKSSAESFQTININNFVNSIIKLVNLTAYTKTITTINANNNKTIFLTTITSDTLNAKNCNELNISGGSYIATSLIDINNLKINASAVIGGTGSYVGIKAVNCNILFDTMTVQNCSTAISLKNVTGIITSCGGTGNINRINAKYGTDVSYVSSTMSGVDTVETGATVHTTAVAVDEITDGMVLMLLGSDFTNTPQTTSLIDRSGRGNSAIPSGFEYTTASGSDGAGAIKFDAIDSRLTVPRTNLQSITTGDITIEMWFYLDSVPSGGFSMINKYVNDNNNEFVWRCMSGTTMQFFCGTGSTVSGITTVNPQLEAGKLLHYVAVRKNDSYMEIFKNGVSLLKQTGTFAPISTSADISIGRGADGAVAGFKLRKFKMLNRALSAAEVLQNYKAGATV